MSWPAEVTDLTSPLLIGALARDCDVCSARPQTECVGGRGASLYAETGRRIHFSRLTKP